MTKKIILMAFSIILFGLMPFQVIAADIEGNAWTPIEYQKKDGTMHKLTGTGHFINGLWSILFFYPDDNNKPVRAFCSAGTYTLNGDDLVFTHLYMLGGGEAVGSSKKAPLTIKFMPNIEEKCKAVVSGDKFTIHFPSGNKIVLKKFQGT